MAECLNVQGHQYLVVCYTEFSRIKKEVRFEGCREQRQHFWQNCFYILFLSFASHCINTQTKTGLCSWPATSEMLGKSGVTIVNIISKSNFMCPN